VFACSFLLCVAFLLAQKMVLQRKKLFSVKICNEKEKWFIFVCKAFWSTMRKLLLVLEE